MLQEKRENNERLSAAASAQTVQRCRIVWVFENIREETRAEKRRREKQSVCTNLFLHLVFFEKALADCPYAPRDCGTPPCYKRTVCNV